MSASREKKQRQATPDQGLTQRQRKELQEARQAKRKVVTYTVIGVIAAVLVVILLLWLYCSGFVLLIGAEINGIYLEMRAEMAEKKVKVPQYRYLWQCGWIKYRDWKKGTHL